MSQVIGRVASHAAHILALRCAEAIGVYGEPMAVILDERGTLRVEGVPEDALQEDAIGVFSAESGVTALSWSLREAIEEEVKGRAFKPRKAKGKAGKSKE